MPSHVWSNETDHDYGIDNTVVESDGRFSICTYNGVEYLEVRTTIFLGNDLITFVCQGEEVFTRRRCHNCVCQNGEIRCEKEECEDDVAPDELCDGPDYLCNRSGKMPNTTF